MESKDIKKPFVCKCGETNPENFYPYAKYKCKACNIKTVKKRYREMSMDVKTDMVSKNKKAQKTWHKKNVIRYRYLSAKHRAKKKGLEFTITVEFLNDLLIRQNGKCPYLGTELTHQYEGDKYNTISIDRIDSNGGYTEDNVQLISSMVNRIKSVYNTDEFLELIKRIYEYRGL